jgi:hypothetical protein
MARPRLTADRWHIAALVAFAVSQPLLDLIQGSPAFFAAYGAARSVAVLITFLVGLGLPLIVGLIEAGLTWGMPKEDRVRFRTPLIGSLAVLTALPPLNRLLPTSVVWPTIAAITIGAIVAIVYPRLVIFRELLTASIPAIVIFPACFLFTEPVRSLVLAPPVGPHQETVAPGRPAPVVLIVLDELPVTSIMDENGRIDDVRYPNFAAFASTATWFRNATSVSDETIYAVPAILSGRYPVRPRAPTAASYPNNLFSWLGQRYDLHVFENWTELCPTEICDTREVSFAPLAEDLVLLYGQIVLPSGLASLTIPPVEQRWIAIPEEVKAQTMLEDPQLLRARWVADRRGHANAFRNACHPTRLETLCYLHLTFPHVPWQFLPSGRRYGPLDNSWFPTGITEDRWTQDERVIAEGWQRHLLQVGFADALLGNLLAGLRDSAWFDRALVVVTADHGVSFRPGEGLRTRTGTNLPDLAFVPLFVKRPGQVSPETSDVAVQTIDVLPTIADILDMPMPWPVDGHSLYSADVRTRLFHSTTALEPVDSSFAARTDTQRRQAALFGTRTPWDATYRTGPYTHLIGQATRSLPRRPTDLSMTLESPGLYSRVDLKSDFLPARIKGTLRSLDGTRGHDLAIAVNGVIATTTTAATRTGQYTFSAMIPEGAFVDGLNLIQVFDILDEGGTVALLRDQTPTASFSLVRHQGGNALQNSQGSLIPIRSSGFRGNLERADIAFRGVSVSGWAADPEKRPPSEIAVFIGDRFVDIAPLSVARPDLVKGLGLSPFARAGFERRSPLPPTDEGGTVRVFAVWDRRYAFELPRQPWVLVLEDDPMAAQLASFDGDIPIHEWPDSGAIDEAYVQGSRLHLAGWTGSKPDAISRPTRVVALWNGVLVWQGVPTPASARRSSDPAGTARLGFTAQFDLPVTNDVSAQLRVFAVWGNQLATELKWNASRIVRPLSTVAVKSGGQSR